MGSLSDSHPFCVSSGAKIFAITESQFNNVTMNTPLNPNKALWEKGDFRRIADTMRESGEALMRHLESPKGSESWISDAAMAPPRFRLRNRERTCLASISRATWWRLGIGGPGNKG